MANLDLSTASLQHLELTAAQSASSDLDYAFQLQLQEALAASMTTQYQSSSGKNAAAAAATSVTVSVDSNNTHTVVEEGDEMKLLLEMQALEFEKYQQEVTDHQQAVAEMHKFSDEIYRRNHDANFARSLLEMPEDEWEDVGDDYEKPFDTTLVEKDDRPFKLYYKGLISCENVGVNEWDTFAGAGIAILDPDDKVVLQLGKPLASDLSRAAAEYLALTEGLKTGFSLGIRCLDAYGDSVQVYKQVIGRWSVRQRKISKFLQEVEDQVAKMDKVLMVILPRCDNRVALTLAREAIDSQLSRKAEYHHHTDQSRKENCSICLEDNDMSQMYEVMICHHRYCVPCMAQHVEVKLRHGGIPVCPHEGCKTRLTVDGCMKFLSSKWIEILTKRLEEAAIPEPDKVYCPYSDCSALMTKTAIATLAQASSSSHPSMSTDCLKCHRFFCIECRVPWHTNMSCQEYQRRAPQLHGVDAKLHLLAKDNRWRRCTKCKHMIELAEGCYHMTCRCGFEFCYVCGAEWKNKKQTCKCVLWDEQNIIQEPLSDEDYDSEEEYESDYEDEEEPHYQPHYRFRAL